MLTQAMASINGSKGHREQQEVEEGSWYECCSLLLLLCVVCCITQLDFVPLHANNYVKACENVLFLVGCLDALLLKRLALGDDLLRLIMHVMNLFSGKLLFKESCSSFNSGRESNIFEIFCI